MLMKQNLLVKRCRMCLTLLLALILLPAGGSAQSEIHLDVLVPGALSHLIPESEKYNVVSLSVKGELNGDDLRMLREMAGSDVNGIATPGILENLDLSEARMVAGGDPYFSLSGSDGAMHNFYASNDSLGYGTFFSCGSLKRVVLPESLSVVGDWVFANCVSLTELVCPENVKSIGAYAFSSCTSLTQIVLPAGLTEIGKNAFQACYSIRSLNIPGGIKKLEDYAFFYCVNLSEVTLNEGLEEIGHQVFSFNSMKELSLPASVRKISPLAFFYTELRNLKIHPDNPELTVRENVVYSKDLTHLKLFLQYGADTFTVPGHVRVIDTQAFADLLYLLHPENYPEDISVGKPTLKKIILNPELEKVEYGAFALTTDYTVLEEIVCPSINPPACGTQDGEQYWEDVFFMNEEGYGLTVLRVPEGCGQRYREALGWRKFQHILETDLTGIEGMEASDDWKLQPVAGGVKVLQAPAGAELRVYDLQGRLLHQLRANGAEISIPLPAGSVYVVKVNGVSRKVVL